MHPILFEPFSFPISTFGVMMALGFLVVTVLPVFAVDRLDLGYRLALLAPRDPAQVTRAVESATGAVYPLRVEPQIPAVYGENLSGNELLDRSLAALLGDDEPLFTARREHIGAELGATTSLFLTGIGCDLGDVDAVARGVRSARDTLALGLAAVAGVLLPLRQGPTGRSDAADRIADKLAAGSPPSIRGPAPITYW